MKMKTLTFVVAALSAAFAARATIVWRNNVPADSRCVLTGCTYENAITNKVSFGIWVKDPDLANAAQLTLIGGTAHVNLNTSMGRGFGIVYTKGDNRLCLHLCGSDADGKGVGRHGTVSSVDSDASKLTDGKWHFLMLTADCEAQVAKLYIDGDCAVTRDISDVVTFASQRCFTFGGGMSSDTSDTTSPTRNNYGAAMDFKFVEVTLYDRALAADEVAALATKRANPLDRHLVAYWPCARGGNSNWALCAARRTDGSLVNAQPYYTQLVDDPDFLPFDHPAGKYVITPEMAAEYGYVQPSGATMNSIGNCGTNIVEAYNALAAGETLYLLPGVHSPTTGIDNSKSNISIAGYDPATCGPARETAIIDGSLCTTNYLFRDAGNGRKPTIRDLTFRNTGNCRAMTYSGSGAFYVYNCTFTNINADTGAAIYSYTRNQAVISNCLFKTCTTSGGGGAIYTIQNSERSPSDYLTITHCAFEDCHAVGSGSHNGGAVYSNRHNKIFDCSFKDCTVESTNGSSVLGGALQVGGLSEIIRCTFSGAITAISSGYKYGTVMELNGPNTVEDCVISGININSGGFGVIHCSYYGEQFINRLVCTNNNQMSTLFFVESTTRPVTIRNCLAAKSEGKPGPGSFLTGHNSYPVTVENCTVDLSAVNGTSASKSENAYVNCILDGSFTTGGTHYAYLTNCAVTAASGWTDGEDIWTRSNFGFNGKEQGDYSLRKNSFCQDKGILLPWMTVESVDVAGNPRVFSRQTGRPLAEDESALPDLGCYESQWMPISTVITFR